MRFTCYIPCGGDPQLLVRAVGSLLPQLDPYPDAKVVVVNNTEGALPYDKVLADDRVTQWDAPVKLLHGQSINWMIRMAEHRCEPFCMSLHNDAMLYPGAVDELLSKWESVKDTNWGTITLGRGNGDAFVLWNPLYNYRENVWHDPFLFPMYYMDNHYYRIQTLRGWQIHHTDHELVLHEGSHTLKNDPVFCRKNNIVFGKHGEIYTAIWGGLPGAETVTDPFAKGTCYPRP